ncbi:hypothetical protein DPMN_083393 [Dreissena polymorpha]|uniref:Uncharacterized protein n=1 Tax=Dreissena polymorpha TaxID=45954 RepID=A0A9D4BIE5_DREPO|nr:hypothetical protein DPMN_083393 [Dreissena polymorpha]
MSGSWVPCLFPSLIAQIRQGWATDEWIMGPMPVSITNSSAGTVLGLQMSGSRVTFLFPSPIAQIRKGWATDNWITGPIPVSITNSSAGTGLGYR